MRCCPSTRHASLSDTSNGRILMQRRRRPGLRSFPRRPRAGSASEASISETALRSRSFSFSSSFSRFTWSELQPAKLLAPAVVGERRHAGLWKATDAQKSALVASTMTRTNRYYSGPQSDHFDGLRFHSPLELPAKGLLELAWMLAGKGRRRWPPLATVQDQDVPPERTEHLRLSSAGHSSILVQGG